MNCPYDDCDGELVVQTVAEFTINDDLTLHMDTVDLTGGEPVVYCSKCPKAPPAYMVDNIRIVVLADLNGLEEKIKEVVNGAS